MPHVLSSPSPARSAIHALAGVFGRIGFGAPDESAHSIDARARVLAIFLRNVLIYFVAPTKAAVVDRVLPSLRPGGLFFIGMAEGRVQCTTVLRTLAPGAFRKAES